MSSVNIGRTGYGPRNRWSRMYFDWDKREYKQWEMEFLGYMRLQSLKDSTVWDATWCRKEQGSFHWIDKVSWWPQLGTNYDRCSWWWL